MTAEWQSAADGSALTTIYVSEDDAANASIDKVKACAVLSTITGVTDINFRVTLPGVGGFALNVYLDGSGTIIDVWTPPWMGTTVSNITVSGTSAPYTVCISLPFGVFVTQLGTDPTLTVGLTLGVSVSELVLVSVPLAPQSSPYLLLVAPPCGWCRHYYPSCMPRFKVLICRRQLSIHPKTDVTDGRTSLVCD